MSWLNSLLRVESLPKNDLLQNIARMTDSVIGDRYENLPIPVALDRAAEHVSKILGSDAFPFQLRDVRLSELSFARAFLCVALAPLIWNSVARVEHHTRMISSVLGRKLGAYLFAMWIFCFSLYRDALFMQAIETQPKVSELDQPWIIGLGSLLFLCGIVLVCSSMLRLGVLGTYLGDYFGMYLDEKIESFPFNLFDHPMCVELLFLQRAL